MSMRSLYQVLQVDSEASPEVIEAAYRRLARKYHPDVNSAPEALAIMQEINEAYRVLSDPVRRQDYDASLRNGRDDGRPQRRQAPPAQSDTSPGQTGDENAREAPQSSSFFVQCQKCGAVDSTLRLAVFPYVISLLVVTFRRAWNGVYCARCRGQEMTRAKLLSLLLGWWGVPWGLLYTLGVLFMPSQGDIPAEANASFLRALAAFFLKSGRVIDAEQALNASLAYKYDQEVDEVYQRLFRRKPNRGGVPTHGALAGALFGIVVISSPIVFAFILNLSSVPATPQYSAVVSPQPTSMLLASPMPVATKKTIPTPTEGWSSYTSRESRFSALIPPGYESEEYPWSSENPFYGTSFAPAIAEADSRVISVMALPVPEMDSSSLPSYTELHSLARDWMEKMEVEIIMSPHSTGHRGAVAVKMVHERTLSDSDLKVRAYAAMVAVPGWIYYVEVAGLSEQDEGIHKYFDAFLDSFTPLDE